MIPIKRRPKGVRRYSTSTGGFSPKTERCRMPKRIILRSRSFITFADSPGQALRNALGRLYPSAHNWSSRTDHLHPTMLSTIEATGMDLPSFDPRGALTEASF